MPYIDGVVLAVPKKNKEIYIKYAINAAKIFKEHGALELVECWGDDVPEGKVTSFPLAVKCKEDEVVCFSWIKWPSKEVRDDGMKKSIEDSRMNPDSSPMPFDGKRMIFGGFNIVVNE